MGSVCSRNPVVINKTPSQINEYSRNTDIRKKYEFVSILGSGSFGKVRLYRDRKWKGMKYAPGSGGGGRVITIYDNTKNISIDDKYST